MLSDITQKIKAAPNNPGVYIFYRDKKVLYVGKASNLRNRLKSYLRITDLKTKALHQEASTLKIIALRSNIEALIVESQLIKKLKPKYNVLFRDDKNYFYVSISKEQFPRILIVHQFQDKNKEYIGPFTEGRAIKVILRLLRKFFPYCAHNPHFRICLDAQINNCPGYCCQKQDVRHKKEDVRNREDYLKNINKIKNILTGKNKRFIHQLKDPYELLILEKIWAHKPYLEVRHKKEDIRKSEHKDENLLTPTSYFLNLKSVECYDNSHLSGKEAVGAMTAWQKQITTDYKQRQATTWVANKSMWRKFKIRGNYTEDDPRMIEEIVSRRLNHPEWPYPDLIIIDGGITQLNAAQRAIEKNKKLNPNPSTPYPKVISFAKPNQEIYGLKPLPVPITELPEEFQKLIRTAIQNTHNFAIRYHRQVRRRAIINL